MAFGNSFASFVNGFTSGRDIRHKWEDREAAKERQKILDGYEAERQKRIGEAHGWDRDRHGIAMGTAADADRARDQEWSDSQSMRSALNSAFGAAEAGMGASPDATGPGVMNFLPVSQPGPVEQAAASVGGMGSAPDQPFTIRPGEAGGAAAVTPVNAPASGALGIAPDSDPLLMDRGDGTVTPLRGPRNAAEQRTIAEAAKAGRLVQDDAAAARQRQIDAAGTSRQQEGAVARTLRRNEGHEWGLPGGAGADLAEAAKLPARGAIGLADAAANVGARGVRQVNEPVNAIAKWLTGKDFGQPSNADTLNRNAPDFPDAPKAKENEVAAAASDIVTEATASPAGAAAVAAMPDLGAKPGVSLTPAQTERAAVGLMQSYRDNGLPIITKELMRQGKFTEAETLRAFVNEAATQEGMKSWSSAVFAAMSGDIDTAAGKMIDAYNTSGYFDDGFEIVKDQTELIRADDGEVMGVRLAMRNQQTGEVSVQESEISDLIQRGLWLLSPEKAAEQYLAQQQAIQAQLLEMDAERRKAGADIIKEDQKAANNAALKIYEAHIGLDGKPSISYEEALAMATGTATAPGEDESVPMLRRPQ